MAEITYVAATVLQAVHSGWRHGFQIMEAARLPSGTVYPALRRLEAAGLIRSHWESESAAHAGGRPARRYYELTQLGEEALAATSERFRFPELAAAEKPSR